MYIYMCVYIRIFERIFVVRPGFLWGGGGGGAK